MLRFDFDLVSYGRRVPAQSKPHEMYIGLDLLLDRPVHANALVLHHQTQIGPRMTCRLSVMSSAHVRTQPCSPCRGECGEEVHGLSREQLREVQCGVTGPARSAAARCNMAHLPLFSRGGPGAFYIFFSPPHNLYPQNPSGRWTPVARYTFSYFVLCIIVWLCE